MTDPLDLHEALATDLSGEDLASLRRDVRTHFDALVNAQASQELLAIDIAELLCTRLELLLDAASSLSSEARGAIVGAARYFVSTDDAVPDDRACVGLDDDVIVFNHVVHLIGRADLEIVE